MPQLEFNLFWHQYFWTSFTFFTLLYTLSELYLKNIAISRAFRLSKIEFMQIYEEFTTIDPITRGYVIGSVFLSFFYPNFTLTKDFRKLFVSHTSISDLEHSLALLRFYNTRRQFEFYVYNTHDDFESYYRFYKKEQRRALLLLIKTVR